MAFGNNTSWTYIMMVGSRKCVAGDLRSVPKRLRIMPVVPTLKLHACDTAILMYDEVSEVDELLVFHPFVFDNQDQSDCL